MNTVRKAVIPLSGVGTRMLPVTKTVPKALLPIVDKPTIQIIVEELVEAGITDIIMVAPPDGLIAEYFQADNRELLEHLRAKGSQDLIDILNAVKHLAHFTFIRQEPVYGTGIPVLNAEAYLNNEPFIYTFGDDFFVSKINSYQQMLSAYEAYGAPIYGCQKRTGETDYDRYGYVGGKVLAPGVVSVTALAERPGKANTPGDLASFGGFVVTPEVLPYLHRVRENLPAGKELYFNSALKCMVEEGKQVIAKEIVDAEYFDTGNKLEYMKTCVTMAARHPEIGAQFKEFLKEFQP